MDDASCHSESTTDDHTHRGSLAGRFDDARHPPTTSRRRWLGGLVALGGGLLACARGGRLPRVDAPSGAVRALAATVVAGAEGPVERAIAIHRFVRDEIRFGFTRDFDRAEPARTLSAARGHCNPKAALFASMVSAAGIEARVRFFTIDDRVLHDVFAPPAAPPTRLTHAITEVRVGGAWVGVDSYVTDRPLLTYARRRLHETGRTLGWGAHRDGTDVWDGRSPSFVQLVDPERMAFEDHGAFVDLNEFFDSDAYVQRLGPLERLLFSTFAVSPTNARLDELRAQA